MRPTVGFMPTTLLTEAGLKMLPLVSEPNEAKARLIDEATALPLEDPLGSCGALRLETSKKLEGK